MNVYDLWIPTVASGFATHVMSTLAWTVMPHHKPELKKLPVEDELLALLDEKHVPPDQYLFPFAESNAEMASEDFKHKQAKCRGELLLWPNVPNMGIAIGQTLLFFLVTAFVIAYLASLALPEGAEFMKVFQFVTTAGLLAHCAGIFPGVFWFKRKIAMDLVDKVAYAIVTGLIFAALWP
ncbi:MAG TPA: hypothetical protein VLA12_11525 [Planctomycetaceae bacterium]|nr:hypothetical protein [Planctomycetaceae bacterium]